MNKAYPWLVLLVVVTVGFHPSSLAASFSPVRAGGHDAETEFGAEHAPAGVARTDITFQGDGHIALYGTLVAPTAAGRHRGLVMIEGAGPVTRYEFAAEADAFARRGIVTLIYDKRTIGYSLLQRSYALLARDALRALQWLRQQDGVDPSQVGFYGLSEGAWVGPLAASQSKDVAFLITAGAVGLTPLDQTVWSNTEFLRHWGVHGSFPHTIRKGLQLFTDIGWFPEAHYDTVPVWEHVDQPTLLLWGALDRYAVIDESSKIIEQALRRGGNLHFAVRFVPNASHSLHVTHNNGFDHLSAMPPGLADMVASWINGLPNSASGIHIDEAPPQNLSSAPLAPLQWYESGWIQIVAVLFLVVAFASYPLVTWIRRVSERPGAGPAQAPMRWLAACGFISVAIGSLYLVFVTITNSNIVGPVVLGDPAPWFIVHLTAAATVIAAVWMIVASYWSGDTITGGRFQFRFMLFTAGVFAVWAGYWGMLSV